MTALAEVGIYRSNFGLPSEAFLVEQVGALERYRPLVLTRAAAGEAPFDVLSLRDQPLGRLREPAFALTRDARLFGAADRLRRLALVHAHFGPDGVFALGITQRLAIPLVVTFHGFDATVTRASLCAKRKWYALQFVAREAQLRREATRFIAISQFIRSCLLERGYPAEKIVQHYIGVDTSKFSPGTRSADRYVLCVGRMAAKKGLDTLLRAFARIAQRHPSVRLVHVGSGPLDAELRALAASLGIVDRIDLRGSLPHDEVLALMRGAEVFALPSRRAHDGDSEGLGIVFNEASACGIPIAATLHGGIPEAVLHGETGLLSPENDDEGLADHLDLLLGDRALAAQLGRRGREYVCDVFDLHKQTRTLETIYDDAITAWQQSSRRRR